MNEPGQRMRDRLIEALRRRYARTGTKRAEIRLILIATAVVGWIASAAMLWLGVVEMWMRYPLAALAGWLAFLGMVRLWAEVERKQFRSEEEIDQLAASAGNSALSRKEREGLGDVGRWWDWFERFNPFDFIDDGAGCLVGLILLVVIVALAGLIVAVIGLIGGAELLLAEVVLDAVLVSALYRRLKHLEARWWLEGAMRQTAVPVLLSMVFLASAGLLFQQVAPDAHSIGEVWREVRPPWTQR